MYNIFLEMGKLSIVDYILMNESRKIYSCPIITWLFSQGAYMAIMKLPLRAKYGMFLWDQSLMYALFSCFCHIIQKLELD